MTKQTKKRTFWILGGDLRQHWLARKLAEDGHKVHTYGLDATYLESDNSIEVEHNLEGCHRADCVIFPLPMTNKEGHLTAPFHEKALPLSQIFEKVTENQLLVGGQVTPLVKAIAEPKRLTIHDYFAREELTIANAIPTAEGCLQVAMERLSTTIHGCEVLVLGYGHVGKATAKAFAALGAKVTICARRIAPLAQAKADGFTPLPLSDMAKQGEQFSLLVNTVPSQILGEPQLISLHASCLLIDLASAPGGIDLTVAERLHCTVVPALSLPGKVAPATAGLAIKETLYNILEERLERTAII